MRRLLSEPPPEFVLEFSEAGIAWAHHNKKLDTGYMPLEPETLSVSPVRDNVLKPDVLEAAVRSLAPPDGNKRRPAAIILPDYCGRVAVLDFDSFPGEAHEQAALVRFRVKKSVPFDLDAASVSFAVQPGSGKRKDVVVAVVSLEILARYEAPLRVAGLHPGIVTISALAALNLLRAGALEVTAKLTGRYLSVLVTDSNSLKMVRCVELEHVTTDEVMAVLFPTFAFVEDEMKRRPERLLVCGFGAACDGMAEQLGAELSVPVEPLRSLYGPPGAFNSGLYGYLQGVEAA
ncbi:MAG: hypothetical protein SFV51_09635 [Bryobacteraceae bacterium]|nr:hypothetical protein [Bryobacteraceae bacterium]